MKTEGFTKIGPASTVFTGFAAPKPSYGAKKDGVLEERRSPKCIAAANLQPTNSKSDSLKGVCAAERIETKRAKTEDRVLLPTSPAGPWAQ